MLEQLVKTDTNISLRGRLVGLFIVANLR